MYISLNLYKQRGRDMDRDTHMANYENKFLGNQGSNAETWKLTFYHSVRKTSQILFLHAPVSKATISNENTKCTFPCIVHEK